MLLDAASSAVSSVTSVIPASISSLNPTAILNFKKVASQVEIEGKTDVNRKADVEGKTDSANAPAPIGPAAVETPPVVPVQSGEHLSIAQSQLQKQLELLGEIRDLLKSNK